MQQPTRPRFQRFELHSRLGSGAQGRVYLAWDPQLERKVALKILNRPEPGAGSLDQFLSEARAAAKIASPHVVPVFEAGSEKGLPFVVFELVEGQPLRDYLAQPRLGAQSATDLFEQLLEGMAAAHTQGIAHLDLSLNNILLDKQNRLRVMDFGLSRLVTKPSLSDGFDDLLGTPRYMSPEHFSGDPLDLRTDVFALGLIFFELLAGQPAAFATNFSDLAIQIGAVQFEWALLSDVRPEIQSIVRDALQVDPSARFQSAAAMLGALRDAKTVVTARENQDLAVQFLLRRLQRRPEFPAFSNSINEINRMTADSASAGVHELSAVVMQDFNLSNRLMKVASSAFFTASDDGPTTVPQAIARVGTKTVRMICNGLMMFEHLKSDNPRLQDALVASFVAGLLGRMLGQKVRRDLADEAFVAAMFNRLGRNLLIYYLDDEAEEIERRIARGVPPRQAEQEVLATTSSALGAAIAATWKFPPALIKSIAPVAAGILPPVGVDRDYACHLAHFPNELCELAAQANSAQTPNERLTYLGARYREVFRTTPGVLAEMLEITLEKFTELAPSLGIALGANGFYLRGQQFLAEFYLAAGQDSEGTPAQAAAG
ncbi:MAG: serine/threonine protein kinase [Gammaproteobacteria bacterium]|nr:serine/threonine protein kinase [Gammaproteobacteria bacterium]